MSQVKLPEKVFAFTVEKALFSAPCHVLLGLSGGADSMALLDVLCHWPQEGLRVTAVHVHHGLRGDTADRDEQFVRKSCEKYGVSLVVKHVDVQALVEEERCSVEDAARRLRYEAFEETRLACGADFIVTAHTASDQAETVLMRIIRGCSIDGLMGILPVRGLICRPLLACSRKEIETYCIERHIDFITDETNADIRYTRNFIRHELIPRMKRLNPSVEEALFRLADHSCEEVAYLDANAAQALLQENGYLTNMDPVLRRRCIRNSLFASCVPSVEEVHIRAIDQAIVRGNGQVDLPGDHTAHIHKGKLTVLADKEDTPLPKEPVSVASLPCEVAFGDLTVSLMVTNEEDGVCEENVYKLFFNNRIDYDTIQGDLYLRPRRTGDRIRPAGRGVTKSIKKLMNEWGMPPHLRDRYPLLCDEEGIVLIPDYTCAERVKVTKDTKHFLVWQTQKE